MKSHLLLAAAARLHAPLLVLFALVLLATRGPVGIGFVAGLAFSTAVLLHALVYGAGASQAAFPLPTVRVCMALGMVGVVVGAGAGGWREAARLIEAGLFLTTASCGSLIAAVLLGRASALSDEEW